MAIANRPLMEPELRTMLARHREELLRRALALAVRRASLDELAERPLGDRLDDLELLFEAAAADRPGPQQPPGHFDLHVEMNRQLDLHRRDGSVFSVAVVAAGRARVARLEHGAAERRADGPDARAWNRALRQSAAPGDIVIDAGDGATAIVLPSHDAREARVAVDRLCQAAWRALGEDGPLAAAGVATFPGDGASATELLAAAYDGLWRLGDVDAAALDDRPPADDEAAEERPPAPVHPLRPL